MAVPVLNGKTQFLDASGVALALGSVSLYVPSTTTPKQTWQDQAKTILNTTPTITLDAGGYAMIYGSGAYRQIVKDALGNTIWDQVAWANDPTEIADTEIAAFAATLSASSGATLVNFSHNNRGAHGNISWKLTETASVTDPPFSAAADGTADDYAAINAAKATGRQIVFPAGTYKVGTSITLANIIMLPGAVLKPAAGVTITLTGNPLIPLLQSFDTSLTGLIVLDPASNIWGSPEWWGAVPGGADCYAAIMACYTASRRMRFQAASYYTSATLIFDQAFKCIEGADRDYNGAEGQATRILVSGGVNNVVQFGPTTLPGGGFNSFPQGIECRRIWFARTAAPTIAGGSVGVVIQYTLRGYFEDISSAESITGFLVRGTVDTELEACRAFRSTAGTGGGTDKWYGYDADGSINIGAAGGNASLRITNCRSAYGGTPPLNSIGLRLHGAITDTFVKEFEDVTDMVGIQVTGLGATDTNITGNMDVLFQHPVCDQNGTAPFYIQDINPYGSIEFVSPYGGAASGATAGIIIQNCAGTVSIRGGQIPMTGAANVPGISADTCQRLVIDRTIVMESSSAVAAVVLNNCSGDIRPVVSNYQNVIPSAVAVTGASTTALRIEPQVSGASGKIAHGITVASGAASNCLYDVSAVNKAILSGAKLTIAGVDQTTPGAVPTGGGGTSVLVGPTT